MRRPATLVGGLVVLLAAAVPAAAATRVERLPLALAGTRPVADAGGWRPLGTARDARGLSLAAVVWRGRSDVPVRVRGVHADGSRTPWFAISGGDAPRTRDGLAAAGPVWLGRVVAVEAQAQGALDAPRLVAIDPGPDPATPAATLPLARAAGGVPQPRIVSRAGWGADESMRGEPSYAPAVRFAVVHHTEGGNTYTRAEAASVVRGIYAYHVREQGWKDIGYNALVDRFGTIYEGRAGGLTRPVIGAHARGFNTGSFGVSLIGNYMDVAPPAVQVAALARLLAWRLDVAHVDPLGAVRAVSAGGSGVRWPDGTAVVLPTIVGHRDVNWTDCPGDVLHPRLPALRKQVDALGGLRIFSPSAGIAGGAVHVRARLSADAPWTASIYDGTTLVGSLDGTAQDVAFDWTPPDALAGRLPTLTWRIEASTADGVAARPATGPVGGPVSTVGPVADLAARPGVLDTYPDGSVRVEWTQGVAGRTAVAVVDPTGATVATVMRWRSLGIGIQSATWDGRGPDGPLPSGRYRVLVRVGAPGGEVRQAIDLEVRREVGDLAASPYVTPGRNGHDRLSVTFFRIVPGSTNLSLLDGERPVWRIWGRKDQPAGPFTATFAPPAGLEGRFTLLLRAAGHGIEQTRTQTVVIDRTPPRLAIRGDAPSGTRGTRLLLVRASERVVFWLRRRDGSLIRSGGLLEGDTGIRVRAADLRAGVVVRYRDLAGLVGIPRGYRG